jgi:hypothetical protein
MRSLPPDPTRLIGTLHCSVLRSASMGFGGLRPARSVRREVVLVEDRPRSAPRGRWNGALWLLRRARVASAVEWCQAELATSNTRFISQKPARSGALVGS